MVTPYLTFDGDCRKAIDFYENAFDAKVHSIQTYDDYIPQGLSSPPEDLSGWVLHAEMEICGNIFWFADEVSEPVNKGNNVKLTVTVSKASDAQKIYDALNDGAKITLPPTETFYSTFHAGIVDKFGISWNIVAEEPPAK